MSRRKDLSLRHPRHVEPLERRVLLAVEPLGIGQFIGRAGQFGQIQDTTLFTTTDFPSGQKLWSTDGTASGTGLVKDLDLNPSTGGAWFIGGRDNALAIGNSFYFTGVDNAHGRELWVSNGTASGTRMVKDLVPGPGDSEPEGFIALGNQLIFTADRKLWRTDGTAAGTIMLKSADPLGASAPERMAALNGHVYFTIYPQSSPYNSNYSTGQLFRTDGTVAGTVLVKDVSPGVDPTNVSDSRSGLINVNGTLYFSANDGVHGWELWRSDGTAEGTKLFRDLAGPGPDPFRDGSYPSNLTKVGTTLMFSADGFLWKLDQTGALFKLKTVSNPRGFVDVNGNLFFASFDALWMSNGTQAGSVQVGSITPEERFGPGAVASLNGRMYLGGSVDSGFELYETDGEAARTQIVFDAEPGAASSNAVPLGRIGSKVIFTARNDTTALWQVYAATIPQPYAPRNLAIARPADTGVRAADRITLVNRPPITGQAPADSLVRLFIDDVEVGTGIARKGVFEITPGTPLADGNHAVRATATDDLGRVSALSQVIGIRIDTNAPRVRFNPPTQQAVEMRFTEKVAISKSDLRLKNLSTNQTISNSSLDLDYSTTTNIARLTFSGMPAGLSPGHYELKLEPTGITDVAGNALAPGTTFAFSPKLGPAVGASKTILRINGTGADDRITIRRKAGVANLLEVLVNGAVSTRSIGSIESIRIESFAGDDVIRFDSSRGEIKIPTAIYAGAGHDAIFAGDGRDRIYGGPGDDQIHGSGGNDILYGEAGRDRIFGGRGSDHVVGGLHADVIQGDDGTDRLVIQQGVDRVTRDRLDTLVRDTV